MHMPQARRVLAVGVSALLLALMLVPSYTGASSHREAPMISQDPAADATDFYMFRSPDKPDTVTFIASYYPFQDPAGGPNFYRFGDDVLYAINIDDNADNIVDIQYQFRFTTKIQNPNTFAYATGPIKSLTDPNWNIRQYYSVTRILSNGTSTLLANNLVVPPVNIGPVSTPNYDSLANAAIATLPDGSKVFAGQRDDPFFVDLGETFDLVSIRNGLGNKGGGRDDLSGYNVLSIALQVPITSVTNNGLAPQKTTDPFAIIGAWTTAYRQQTRVLQPSGAAPKTDGPWVQVSRLGAPLVNEVVVPVGAKDLWNWSEPKDDGQFLGGVTDPELAKLFKLLYKIDVPPAPRNDLVSIFLTGIDGLTKPANVMPSEQLRLNLAVPVAMIPNRMGVLGGDTAGYPNGRRLVDDVVDISLQAVAGGTPFTPAQNKAPNNVLGDGVDQNDAAFLAAFPYVASPWSGTDHAHHRMEPAR